MKKIFFITLLGTAFSMTLWAQEKIIELNASPATINTSNVPFNQVIVLDNRIDTSKIGMAQVGAFNKLVPFRFNESVSDAVKQYIQSAISNLQTEPKTLLINIKKLMTFEKTYFSKEKGFVEFSADAYFQSGDTGYLKVFSIDTLYVMQGLDVTKAVLSKIPELFDNLVYQVSINYSRNMNTGELVSYHEISTGIRNQWAQFPINKLPYYKKGVYKTFDDFRSNIIDTTADMAIVINNDSIYKVYHTKGDGTPDEKHPIMDIWGVNDGNRIFLRINFILVPLQERNNTFHFIASIKDFSKQSISKGTEVAITGMADNQGYSMVTGFLVSSVRRSEFYLDMDDGKMVEYKVIHK